ncbi:MAG: hypothetical protein K6G86_00405 [Bacteroidales bacterium]|nr:hypothetical protein [Bacteroidales bacterium]
MEQWTHLVIDVDYSPRDPGTDNWFCERTVYAKSDLQAGMPLRYKDPGELFGGIRLLELTDEGVVLAYGDHQYGLSLDYPYGPLDQAGRDYTEFELNVYLEGQPDEDVEEIEQDCLPDEPEDDDGRWDAYV